MVGAHVVYINPDFHMHDPEEQEKYLLRLQITRHLQKLNQIRTPLSPSNYRMARLLEEAHFPNYVNDELPKYTYAKAQKGSCYHCDSLRTVVAGKTLFYTHARRKYRRARQSGTVSEISSCCSRMKGYLPAEYKISTPKKIGTPKMGCAFTGRFSMGGLL